MVNVLNNYETLESLDLFFGICLSGEEISN